VERHQQSLNQLNFATQQPLSGTYNLPQLEEEDKKVTQIMDATRDILDTMPGASIIILPHQRASDQVFGAAQSLSYSASSRYVESSSQGKPPVTINETATFPTTIKCANLRTAISNMPKSTPSTKATQNATQTSPSSRDNKVRLIEKSSVWSFANEYRAWIGIKARARMTTKLRLLALS